MTKTLDMPAHETLCREADSFFQQGNYTQALHCYKRIEAKGEDPLVSEQIQACYHQLLRKFWRQDRPEDFAKLMKETPFGSSLQLCLARLKGLNAVEAVLPLSKTCLNLIKADQ